MCPNDISSLADLLLEKSDEYDLKGYMDVLTKCEAKQLTKAVVNEVTTVKGFNDTLTVDEAIKDKAIWNELECLQKIGDLTRGEFVELAKIAQESGVIQTALLELLKERRAAATSPPAAAPVAQEQNATHDNLAGDN